MLGRKWRAFQLERLESRVLLAADAFALSPIREPVKTVQPSLESEAVESRALQEEPRNVAVADVARSDALKVTFILPVKSTPQNVRPTSPPVLVKQIIDATGSELAKPEIVREAIKISREKVEVTKSITNKLVPARHTLDAVEAYQPVTSSLAPASLIRNEVVSRQTIQVLNQRMELDVLPTSDEVTKAIDGAREDIRQERMAETSRPDASAHQDENLSTQVATRSAPSTFAIAESIPTASSNDQRLAAAFVAQTVSRNSEFGGPQSLAANATLAEDAAPTTEATGPGNAPLQASMSVTAAPPTEPLPLPPAAVTVSAQLVTSDSPMNDVAQGLPVLPASNSAAAVAYEPLPMAKGAVFAVALGSPLVRFASAADSPGDHLGGSVQVSGTSNLPKGRSRRRRGKDREASMEVIEDFASPSRTEPYATLLTVAADAPPHLPGQVSPPRLATSFAHVTLAESYTVHTHRTQTHESWTGESYDTNPMQFSSVISSGGLAAGTLAVLAYERVLQYRDKLAASPTARPMANGTTRLRVEAKPV